MFKIENKTESYEMILKLGLNKLPEVFVKKWNKKQVEDFLKKYPSTYYAVRNKAKAGSKLFNFKVKAEDVMDYVYGRNMFSINVSSYSFLEHQKLTGEIKISKNGELSLSASSNPEFSARDGAQMPDYSINSNIFDSSLKYIPGLQKVVDYIFAHDLFDVIVEFASFDIKVGTKNEYVAIFELRTDY